MVWGSLRARTRTVKMVNEVASAKGLSQDKLIELLLLKDLDGKNDIFIRRENDKRKKR